MSQSRSNPTRPNPQAPQPEFDPIDPVWLLKAVAYVILAALVCGYLTLCLLFYQGQWQLILHPDLNNTPLSTLAGLPAQPIRFDAIQTGTPRLSGALIPATEGSRYQSYTVLYLREGDASLAQSPADARNFTVLHNLGLNLFVFDYRGYGESDPTRPDYLRMTEDASAALRYLTETRAIPQAHVIAYGTGAGASLATALAANHPAIPALILDNPGPPPISLVLADPRTKLLPVRALFHENFSLAPLATLTIPKLLISDSTSFQPLPAAFTSAADPKITLELNYADVTHLSSTIARFLDQIIPRSMPPLKE